MSRALLVIVDWATSAPLVGEVLRLALAATATGSVRLLSEASAPPTLDADADRLLEHLRTRGAELELANAAMLRDALGEADDVWCCLPRERATQDVLEIDTTWLAQTPDDALWHELGMARQVLRIRRDVPESRRP